MRWGSDMWTNIPEDEQIGLAVQYTNGDVCSVLQCMGILRLSQPSIAKCGNLRIKKQVT